MSGLTIDEIASLASSECGLKSQTCLDLLEAGWELRFTINEPPTWIRVGL